MDAKFLRNLAAFTRLLAVISQPTELLIFTMWRRTSDMTLKKIGSEKAKT
jgi:hypothetical protein